MRRDLQKYIIQKLGPACRSIQNQRFWPHQQTLQINFTLEVQIAHSTAQEIMRQTLKNSLHEQCRDFRFMRLSKQIRRICLRLKPVLVLHIIDEINFCFIDVQKDAALRIKLTVWNALIHVEHPRKLSNLPYLGSLKNTSSGSWYITGILKSE